jgi:hypothetical protein
MQCECSPRAIDVPIGGSDIDGGGRIFSLPQNKTKTHNTYRYTHTHTHTHTHTKRARTCTQTGRKHVYKYPTSISVSTTHWVSVAELFNNKKLKSINCNEKFRLAPTDNLQKARGGSTRPKIRQLWSCIAGSARGIQKTTKREAPPHTNAVSIA